MTPRRLFRSRDRQLAGVAGGMAEYLDIDPTVVRILWILAVIFSGGLMLLGYIILAFVIPDAPLTAGATTQGWSGYAASAAPAGAAAPSWSPDWQAQAEAERRSRERSRGRGPGAAVIVGVMLVVFGAIALFDSMMPAWFAAAVFGPALVIALGAALLVGSVRRNEAPAATWATSAATPAGGIPGAEPAPATGTGTGYDAEATASVDLGAAADHVDPDPGTDLR